MIARPPIIQLAIRRRDRDPIGSRFFNANRGIRSALLPTISLPLTPLASVKSAAGPFGSFSTRGFAEYRCAMGGIADPSGAFRPGRLSNQRRNGNGAMATAVIRVQAIVRILVRSPRRARTERAFHVRGSFKVTIARVIPH